MATKKELATAVYDSNPGKPRKEVMRLIMAQCGVGEAYASTLYSQIKKANAPAISHLTAFATNHTPPNTSSTSKATIQKFDRPTCRVVGQAIEKALEAVEQELGVRIKREGGTYSNTEFTTKIRISVGDTDIAKKDWDLHCHAFGLKPEQFGTTFVSRGTTFTVCGIKPRATRFPILAVNANGTRYKFPANKIGGVEPAPRRPRGMSGWF